MIVRSGMGDDEAPDPCASGMIGGECDEEALALFRTFGPGNLFSKEYQERKAAEKAAASGSDFKSAATWLFVALGVVAAAAFVMPKR